MKNKVLIVVDMQNDFVTGVLATEESKKIIPAIQEKIKTYNDNEDDIIFTQDTHYDYYLETQEGKKLPIEHCKKGSEGWQIISELNVEDSYVITKEQFNISLEDIYDLDDIVTNIDTIELCGVCTDICVISNALLLKAIYPEKIIQVDRNACAGTSLEKHSAALQVMESCQIEIIGEE